MHDRDGMDGVHSHMTNTRNAPVEAIEAEYPLRVRSYGLAARHRGRRAAGAAASGMHREFDILGDYTRLTVSSDRQRVPPWGAFGGRRGDRVVATSSGAASGRHATSARCPPAVAR